MRLRSVSLAALLAVIAPAAPVFAQTSAAPTPATSPQAEELRAAPVAELVSEVAIPWTR